jgi:hypothetical protein
MSKNGKQERSNDSLLGIIDDIDSAKHLVAAAWMATNYLENPEADALGELLNKIEHHLSDVSARTLAFYRKADAHSPPSQACAALGPD